MKKLIFLVAFFSVCLTACNDCDDMNLKTTIPLSQVIQMAKNRSIIVTKYPQYAYYQIGLTKQALICLSKKSNSVKFIAAAYNSTDAASLTTVLEMRNTDTFMFYDLQKVFPVMSPLFKTGKAGCSNCPLPDNCPIP